MVSIVPSSHIAKRILTVMKKSFGSLVLAPDVSVCFETDPKIKLQEALNGMNAFRVPGNFRVAFESDPKIILKEASYGMHGFGWAHR